MKIAFVTATRPHAGGMIVYLNNLSYGARKLGHDADIISIFETAKQRKKMHGVDNFLENILIGRDWLGFLAFQTIKIIIFFRFLKNYLQKKYDLIYVTDIVAYNAIRPLEKLFKIPVILNPIDSIYSILISKKIVRPGGWFMSYIIKQEKKSYLNARAMLHIGEDMEKYFQEIADKNFNIPYIPIPFNDSIFYVDKSAGERLKKKYGLENKFIVLYIGRLSPEKGAIYLLRSMPEILKKEPETNIFIAIGGASGPEKENLINYIKNNHYENYVRVLGYIEDEDMRGVYNMADILCAPSVSFEGEVTEYLENKKTKKLKNKIKYTISAATTTLQEAMACAKPVIGTDIPGNREIIEENVDGILVPDKNPAAISEAILKLKNEPDFYKKLSQGGLKNTQKKYLPTSVVKFLIDYYKIKFNK